MSNKVLDANQQRQATILQLCRLLEMIPLVELIASLWNTLYLYSPSFRVL
jgi:hypothetical protein